MRLLLSVGIVAALSASAASAPWEPKAKPARQLLSEGADAFDATDYARAATLFLQSWDAQPSHLARWNAAQSYAAAGDWRRAQHLFERLLTDRTLPRAERTTIEARRQLAAAFISAHDAADAGRWDDARTSYLAILDAEDLDPRDRKHASADLDALAQARAAAEAAARAPSKPESPLAAEPPRPEPPPASAQTHAATIPPPRRDELDAPRLSRWSDTNALIILGGGIAAIGLGAGLRWHAEDLDDQAHDALTPEPDRPGLIDRADSQRTTSTIALVAGGALVVAGAIKFAIPPRRPGPSMATLVPTQDGALVVLGGRF